MPDRLATGIAVVDEMVQGGLPLGSSVVVQSPTEPGTLRLGLAFLAEGLKAGSGGVVVVSSFSAESILAELRDLGVDLDRVIMESRLRIIDRSAQDQSTVPPVDQRGVSAGLPTDLLNLSTALSHAIAAVRGTGPKRAVIELLSSVASALGVKQASVLARAIRIRLDRLRVTSLFLVDKDRHSSAEISTLVQPFDGVIDIERKGDGDSTVHKVGVLHLRETNYDSTYRVISEPLPGWRGHGTDSERRIPGSHPKLGKAPCPRCEADIPTTVSTCPACSIRFVHRPAVESEPPVQASSPPTEGVGGVPEAEGLTPVSMEASMAAPHAAVRTKAVRRPSPERGLTNGLVLERVRSRPVGMTNGLAGRTNGLTNGVGRTNGLTNGVGRTNGIAKGVGRTNGLDAGKPRGRAAQPARLRHARRSDWRWYLVPLAGAVVVLILLVSVPSYVGPSYPIQIDGQFSDWDGVPKLVPPGPAPLNPDIDIVRVAMKDNQAFLSFYVEVQGNALAGGPAPSRVTNAFYAFIDTDRSRSTGYAVQGLGADRMIAINTWGGEVVSASLKAYDDTRGPQDWNAWEPFGTAFAAGSGNRLEFEVRWSDLTPVPGAVEAAFSSRSWDGQSDSADVTATSADPFLLVSQSTVAPVVVNGTSDVLSRMTLRAIDGPVLVDGVNVSLRGTFGPASVSAVDLVDAFGTVLAELPPSPAVRFSFPAIPLATNEVSILTVRAKVNVADGTTIGAFVRDIQDVAASSGVAFIAPVTSPRSLAYVGFVPSGPRIDGAFGEWGNASSDPIGDVQPFFDPDVDLSAYGFQGYQGAAYFMVSTVGTVLNGTLVPSLNAGFIPSNGSGSSNGTLGPPPPPVDGMDSVRFFLDQDGSTATGYRVGGIGADYLVQIVGKSGLILASDASRFNGSSSSDWNWAPTGAVPAAKDRAKLEASLPGVAITNVSRAFFQISGWNGVHDDSAPSNPPLAILSVLSVQVSSVNTHSGPAPGPSGSFNLQTQVLSPNQQWFFTNQAPAVGNPQDCSPTANNYAASTNAGGSAANAALASGQSICWYAPIQTPGSTAAGAWEFNLDVSGSGTNPKYRTQIIHCTQAGCASNSQVFLFDANYTTFGTNVSVTTPTIPAQTLGMNDRIEFRISWNGGSGSSVTVSYNGPSPTPGTSDSWASIPLYQVLAGNQQWFFTSQIPSGNPQDCSPNANNLAATTTPGTSGVSTALSSGQSVCWYTPKQTPASTTAGSWQLNLDISGAGTAPKYQVQIFHCTSASCASNSQILLFDANYTTFGTNVSITTPTISAQTLGTNDRIEFKISWNGGTGSTVTISYNGPSPTPGTSDSWASIPIPEFSDLAFPVAFAAFAPIFGCRRSRKRKTPDASGS